MSVILALQIDPKRPVRRGSAHMWSVVRALTEADRARTITAAEILAQTTRTKMTTVRSWLDTLAAAQILAALPDGGYRCLRRPVLLPHIARDGRIVTFGQDAMWNAMRALKEFSAAEIALSASTEDAPVARASAARYVQALNAAGYFVVEVAGRPGRPGRYRLKPAMQKRVLAPRILRTKLIYDPNINAVVGEARAEEVQP